jgi:hypothetical protein
MDPTTAADAGWPARPGLPPLLAFSARELGAVVAILKHEERPNGCSVPGV